MGCQVLHEEWVANAELCTDSGEQWILDYYLQSFEGEEGAQLYGLRIDKRTHGGELQEREETRAFTESHEDALIMAKAFAKGSVPPVTLLEMADEWQGESELRVMVLNV